MPFDERKSILENIKGVDEVLVLRMINLGSCMNALKKSKLNFLMMKSFFVMVEIEEKTNIPEMSLMVYTFEFGVGGDDKKIQVAGF